MASLPGASALILDYASETVGTAAIPCGFDRQNGDEEVVMYIGIGGLILLILILVILF